MRYLVGSRSPGRRVTLSAAFAAFVVSVLGSGVALNRPAEAQLGLVRHLALESSIPAADATVGTRLDEIRLFFTEAPRIDGTTIRIADAANDLVASTAAAADGEDPTQVFIRPAASLRPGAYTVHWRAIAQDGHAVNGDFGFQVTTE